jgi:hypothetical protein
MRLLGATLAALVLAVALPASSPATPARCPKLLYKDARHGEARKIRVAHMTCRHATKIIRRWQGTEDGECDTRSESCIVFGVYECVNRDVGYDTEVTCVKGASRVKFIDVVPG